MDDDVTWVIASPRVEAVITRLDETVLEPSARAVLARGGSYYRMAPPPPAFEHWRPIIMERCPRDMAWGGGCEDDGVRADLHALFADWIWDEINYELPDGLRVVDLRYAGPTGCGGDQCGSTDCTLMWDVTDVDGVTWRVNVPI